MIASLESQRAAPVTRTIPPGTPNFFHAGFPKTASTWLYHCLREHPEVCTPRQDAIHFLTIHYHEGWQAYSERFSSYRGEPVVADTTPSYACFSWSRQRLYDFNPQAKILLTLRNPIERAYSHYWHLRRKGQCTYAFADVLTNKVDLFNAWIAYGFYGYHLSELLKLFPRSQVQVLLYDDLKADPRAFCRQVFEFLDIDADFVPASIDRPRNVASYHPKLRERVRNLLQGRPWNESEYDRGMGDAVREQLCTIYAADMEVLARQIDRDLSHWK
ncbi:MAG: sulfotransferase [Planctomycetales bacterium]|nr:sulfotransferase [Planctomycetales bacterium]